MSWETQGRQYHGWFGHGTADGDGKADAKAMALTIGYSVVGHLPKAQRGRYESWLGQGGVYTLAEVLPGWVAGSELPGEQFHRTVMGEGASAAVAAHAQEVGRALASPGKDRIEGGRAAGQHFAALVEAARVDAIGRIMSVAARQATTKPVVDLVQDVAQRRAAPQNTASRLLRRPPTAAEVEAARRLRNIDELSRILFNEARGDGREAQIAVSHTIRNRMLRNGDLNVSQERGAYSPAEIVVDGQPDRDALNIIRGIAGGILSGAIADPTNGATHFYSPQRMPKEGDLTGRVDVGGGLEDVPGVTNKAGTLHVRNYRPIWSLSFEPRPMQNLAERNFKFFRQPEGPGRVR